MPHSSFLGNQGPASSVQSLSRVWLFATPCTTARQASLSITNSRSLLKLMSIESVMPPNHLILCCPLFLPPSIFPTIKVFSKESVLCIRWPKYWSVSFNISPSNGYSGLLSFKMDWLDLLAAQGILKSLLQHHSSKVQRSAFFVVQLSHPYMTAGRTIALTRLTSVSKVMSLLFNMPSRLIITFHPRKKHLLISWLQSPSAVRTGQATVGPSETLWEYGHALCFGRVRDHPGDVLGCKTPSPAAITLCLLSSFHLDTLDQEHFQRAASSLYTLFHQCFSNGLLWPHLLFIFFPSFLSFFPLSFFLSFNFSNSLDTASQLLFQWPMKMPHWSARVKSTQYSLLPHQHPINLPW